MKKTKFTEAQIVLPFVKLTPEPSSLRYAVRWGLAKPLFTIGTGAPERKKYGRLGVPELRRLRQLEEENQ